MPSSDSHNPLPVNDDARVRELEAWAIVDRLRATTVDKEHFHQKIREWIALYDAEQARRRAAEVENERLREALEAITHWWKGDAPLDGAGTSYRPDIVARAALDGITPAKAHVRMGEAKHERR